jgi:hypothetical protein
MRSLFIRQSAESKSQRPKLRTSFSVSWGPGCSDTPSNLTNFSCRPCCSHNRLLPWLIKSRRHLCLGHSRCSMFSQLRTIRRRCMATLSNTANLRCTRKRHQCQPSRKATVTSAVRRATGRSRVHTTSNRPKSSRLQMRVNLESRIANHVLAA